MAEFHRDRDKMELPRAHLSAACLAIERAMWLGQEVLGSMMVKRLYPGSRRPDRVWAFSLAS